MSQFLTPIHFAAHILDPKYLANFNLERKSLFQEDSDNSSNEDN